MSYMRVGVPRNTSNGDYGRFMFIPNMSSNQQMQQPNGHYSTDGNRMMQHVHYPNCPNRNSSNTFSDGMKDYTIEYGEDAVRAALGGNMPDFQAQFQKQYGGGDVTTGGEGTQMGNMMNGQSKVSMIPVVLTSEGDDNEGGNVTTNASVSASKQEVHNVPNQSSAGETPLATGGAYTASPSETENREESSGSTMAPKQENIAHAYEAVRKARSTSQVKYGRHIRPSYWKPETPNPCRKKVAGGGGDVNSNDAVNNSNQQEMNGATPDMHFAGSPYSTDMNMNDMMMNANGYFAPPPIIPANDQHQNNYAIQRARSMPPKQATRPTYSLCGKCKKCKNLRSETPEASVLTFPKYSTGGFQRLAQRPPQMLTSSNLGQSAKNFRAIRFSSNHM